jgi:hypothetical protein
MPSRVVPTRVVPTRVVPAHSREVHFLPIGSEQRMEFLVISIHDLELEYIVIEHAVIPTYSNKTSSKTSVHVFGFTVQIISSQPRRRPTPALTL